MPAEWGWGWDHADADLTGRAIAAEEPVERQRFVIGDRVTHPDYGRGTVVVLLPYLAVDFDQVVHRSLDGDEHRVAFTGGHENEVRLSAEAPSNPLFAIGDRVRHPQAGLGTVVGIRPVSVDFDHDRAGSSPVVFFDLSKLRPSLKPTSHKLTGVGGVFCASHSPNGVPIHGHTWEVTAWFPAGDADELRDRLHVLLKRWDHTHLPDHIAWGEDLAEHIGFLLPGAVRVQVSRPLERIYAEWKLV